MRWRLYLNLIVWIFLLFIFLALLYWVIKSAINDSELITLLRKLNHNLDQKKSNEGNGSNDGKNLSQDKFECPACNIWIPIDSLTCPECGIVLQKE